MLLLVLFFSTGFWEERKLSGFTFVRQLAGVGSQTGLVRRNTSTQAILGCL